MEKLHWTKNHERIFNWLFNTIQETHKSMVKETFILNNIKLLLKFIKNVELSPSSKEQMFFMTARYLDIKNKQDEAILFREEGYKLKTAKDIKEGQNKLDAKEQDKFKHLPFFINIVNSFDMEQLNNKELLLSLLILQPPIRSSFYYGAKVIKSIKDDDKINNFVFLNYKLKKAYYIVNKDKVSDANEYKNFKRSLIEIENKKLVTILLNKYRTNPSIYIFGDKAITNITLLRWLSDVTKIKGLNVDDMRSIFITYAYNKNMTFQEKTELSYKMRHSVMTASKNYFKIVDEDININVNVDNNIDNKKFEKNKRDIIYNCNTKKTVPQKKTIEKYNLKYVNKIWE